MFLGGIRMLDKEFLVDTLRDEYPEEVTEVIYNCQFNGKNYLDVDGLNARLKTLKLLNFNDTLSENDWFELVYELAPDIYDELSYGKIAA
ncbi:MAG: hypothetical protein ACJAS4_000807 [Bacteriovoracaceae bacterium]|jgi:hypothetical protein